MVVCPLPVSSSVVVVVRDLTIISYSGTLSSDSGTLFDASLRPTTPMKTSWSSSTDISPEGWVSPLKSSFDAMVLELGCESMDFSGPTEVVDDDADEGVDDLVVEETDDDMPPSGVMFWARGVSSKAFGVCPSLLLPSPRLGFRDAVYMGDIAWTDKSRGIVELSSLQSLGCTSSFPIICRPSGFGKTSFLTMLQSFHNIRDDKAAPARRVFNHLPLDDLFGRDYHFQDHLILSFNLANLDIASPQRFQEDLLDEIDCALSGFIWRYGYLLDIDGSKRVDPAIFDSVGRLDLFRALLEWLMDAQLPVFLIVDNYDSAQRASNGERQITDILYDHFVVPLSHICDQFIRCGIILGQANPAQLRQHCGRDIWTVLGDDRSRDYRLATAFGLTRSEIRHLCITFGVSGVEKEIFASLTGHCFCNQVKETMYCTKDVLDFLRRQPSLANRTYIDNVAATKEQLWNGLGTTA
ncbi:hypothetical protein BDZ89DRAFT_1068508 [Hymenopellis radicata]|nr:hypothetical protein BDZ89DRAFT_1068508 [Hymenopellis radicata]